MAAKKKVATSAPVDVPGWLLESDANRLVAKTKATLAKKWSVARAESIEGALQLAWTLVALRREKEAREVAEHVAERVVAGGPPAVWAAAASCIALAVRLARLENDEARRAALIARLVEPAIETGTLAAWFATARKDVRSAEVDPSQKHALEGFAQGCARAAYVREVAGSPGEGLLSIEALDTLIDEGLQGLRALAR